ncbi:aspartate/glutamate racemase family protein [Pseudidiomarina insulisalsae]|uniref:Aspartate/glutamate racemase n=1 Tax=Pseudidiomarina insulisalsae TaxID=575789 RepID=A0A432YF18_9GAMM|nr:aspartate/glutamate racemase family protein [Pseudidiomarina insulisalsae]RUO59539.1 aspartate/glutamate racemase [Pseudidiomarina insulisalsae]
MKTIGLIGGMSWESTQSYYRQLNEQIRDQLGGLHSAKLVLYSVDFAEIEPLQQQGDWAAAAKILSQAATAVEAAGADFVLLCTNTMHKVAPEIEQAISIPLLHIVDATAAALKADGIRTVGLLGTRFTMEQAFYRERLEALGIDVIVPNQEQRQTIHDSIFQELCLGVTKTESKAAFLETIHDLSEKGAEAIILGCTEIGLLVTSDDTAIPLYDTTKIHVSAATTLALT